MKCPECKKKNEAGAAFCEHCGAPLAETEAWLCAGCGTVVAVAEAFCPECGVPRPDDEAVSPNSEDKSDCGDTEKDNLVGRKTKPIKKDAAETDEPLPSEEDTDSTQKVKPVRRDAPEACPDGDDLPDGPAETTTIGKDDLSEVVVEIKHDKWKAGGVNVLSFRLTNIGGKRYRAELTAGITMVDQHETTSEHELAPETMAKVFGFHFKTPDSGHRIVKNIQLALQECEPKQKSGTHKKRVYCVPDDSIQIEVLNKRDNSAPNISIDGGININLKDLYAVDNVNLDVLNGLFKKRDNEEKRGVVWQPIRMVFNPDTPPEKDFVLVDQPPRAKIQSAKLVINGRGSTRKIFLFAKPSLRMGKDACCRDGQENDVILRPYCGRKTDTLRISRLHGRLCIQDGSVYYKDESLNGTEINQAALIKNSQALPDECMLNFAGVLKVTAHTFRMTHQEAEDLSKMLKKYSRELSRIGLPEAGNVNAVRLVRQDNTGHEYILLARRAVIGSSQRATICISEAGVEDAHAHLGYHDGEFLIRNVAEKSEMIVSGHLLEPHEVCPLAPGKTIILGRTQMRFEAVQPEDFKTFD